MITRSRLILLCLLVHHLLPSVSSSRSGASSLPHFCASERAQTAGVAHDQAMKLAMKGDYVNSLWGFRRACDLEPQNSLWWNDLGVTLMRGQRYLAAEASFEAALKLDPRHESAQNNLREVREGYLGRVRGGGEEEGKGRGKRRPLPALQALALALIPEEEGLSLGGTKGCAQLGVQGGREVRLTPPRDQATRAAFLAATGIRHTLGSLPRLHVKDLYAPGNLAYARGEAPYILEGVVGGLGAGVGAGAAETTAALLASRAGNVTFLMDPATSHFANDTTDYYPASMVEHTVHPFLVPFAQAMGELMSPSGAFEASLSPRGGAYAHLNMGEEQWERYLGLLGPLSLPPSLTSPDRWLSQALPSAQARTDFLIGNHWRMLLLGSEGAGMFHHQDILKTASYQLQVAGEKTWHLCPPSQSHLLHVDHDMFAPNYERWPGALQLAHCTLDVVRPGEVVFYPEDYWHQTLNTPPPGLGALSVSITDTITDANNHVRVQAGLRDKCKAPTPFNRGGMIKDACDNLPRLFQWWDREFGGAEGEGREL